MTLQTSLKIIGSLMWVAALIAFGGTFLAKPAHAAGTSANVAWTAPSTYTDGSTLPASDIAFYTVSWAPATGQAGPSGSMKVTAPTTTAIADVPCGSVDFTVTVTTSASALYPNMTSGSSSLVPYATGVSCAPNPPQAVTVQ